MPICAIRYLLPVRVCALFFRSAAGVERGEPVALFAASRPEWIIASLAVIRAGAAAMPVDAQLGEETLRHILADSGVRFAFATTEKARTLDPRMGLATHLLDAGSDDEQSWRQLLAEGPVELPQPGPEDQATLFYTSGTTGLPKGVPLSHANIASQMKAVLESGVITAVDRVALPLPLHHVYPFVIGMLAPLALGADLNPAAGPEGSADRACATRRRCHRDSGRPPAIQRHV